MFDPLIDEMESRILQAKQPVEIEMAFELAGAGSAERMSSPDQPAAQANRSVIPGFENPTQSVPEFSTDAGIEIKLFATNPFLAKPIHMNFDSQGRLWVASSEVYPQIEPGQSANDKIIVLEDTDGDGIADESRIFADGLLIPTGVEPGDGGVYVGHSTELIHLKDTDGDGIADRKRIILSGFGTEDTHHILHSLRWGPDGLLYMNQSIYIHTHMETPHGVVRLNSGGVIHLRPSTMEAGVYVKGFCNPWGHHFDPFGQSFITDGAGYQGISLAVPGAMYFTYAGAPRLMDSISPGSYPKFCGLELIRSPHFPADWQGDAITCDFRAHKVVRFAMNEKDSAYVTTQMPDVVATGDVTFRPIDVKLGPDGALYIADWSNPIIQHGEVDFRDPRRDHVNGRIWRVSYKGSTPAPKQDLTIEPNKILLDNLLSPLGFQREKSRRVLTERGQAILPDLEDWVRTHRDHPSKLEALWIYQSLNLVEPGILSELLRSPAHKIRAAALRIVAHWKSRLPMDFPWQSALSDVHPQVRMEALRTLAAQPVSAADMQKALSVLDHPMDHHLEYALWLTINDLDHVWRSAVLESRMDPNAMAPGRLAYVLQAIPAKSAGDVLSQVLSENQFSPEASGPWVQIIGQAGTIREIDLIYQKLTSGFFNTSGQERVLQALNQAARARRLVPRGPLSGLGAFLQSQNPSVRLAAIPLAGAWKDIREAFSSLAQIPSDQTRTQSERTSAIQALREIGGAGALNALKSASQGERNADLPLRVEATRALATLDTEVAWSQALPLFSESLDDNQALVLWRALLQLKDAGTRLEPWVRGSTLPPRIAELGVRAAQEGGRQLPGLIIALNQAGKLESATQLSAGDLADLARQILQSGDPHLGESVYRRTELGCRTCHAIGGIGGKLGPDMTSIGASAPMDYLIESLYFPNAKIKEGYHAVNIDTIAELTYSGTLVREDADQVWLRDAASKIVQVPKDEIVSRTMADYSLMPSGLLNGLSVVDKVNLFAFLSQLGKSGDFDASRADKARRWFLYPATIDAAQFGEDIILKTDLADNASWRGGWKPFDTLVGGRLLQSDLKQRLQDVASRFPNKLYAGCLFQVAQDGTSEFSLQGFDHAECAAWIDGQSVPINQQKQSLAARLGPGKHTLILSLPVKELPEFIQVTCPSVTFVVE
ncbi:MAG: sorbosone dehydrogenase [Verrucomicrobia bacterium]|nr:sorbosone dehydrogenase [Verrucomicrobiota bacterium]